MTLKTHGAAPTIPYEKLRVSKLAAKAAASVAGRQLKVKADH